jgi:hypothetical protein
VLLRTIYSILIYTLSFHLCFGLVPFGVGCDQMSAMANAPWTLNDGGEDCQVLVYNPQLCVDNPSMSQELFESDVGNEDGLTPGMYLDISNYIVPSRT